MKLKLISGCLAIALMQITPSNAQSVSPAGHYTKKRDGRGEMRVQKSGEGWRVFVTAGGIPRGAATLADCTLISIGEIKGNTFEGEIKYLLAPDAKPGPDNAVDPGQKMIITFAPQSATVPAAAERDKSGDLVSLCGDRSGIFGRYTRDRKR